jgi:hypothetical protein
MKRSIVALLLAALAAAACTTAGQGSTSGDSRQNIDRRYLYQPPQLG